jgi:hypothetical protein
MAGLLRRAGRALGQEVNKEYGDVVMRTAPERLTMPDTSAQIPPAPVKRMARPFRAEDPALSKPRREMVGTSGRSSTKGRR